MVKIVIDFKRVNRVFIKCMHSTSPDKQILRAHLLLSIIN
jgi:hypothetical protein